MINRSFLLSFNLKKISTILRLFNLQKYFYWSHPSVLLIPTKIPKSSDLLLRSECPLELLLLISELSGRKKSFCQVKYSLNILHTIPWFFIKIIIYNFQSIPLGFFLICKIFPYKKYFQYFYSQGLMNTITRNR